jgi:phenylpropionate dioxygenase-like ring-hydroxylating dioxygenase large terminal subunit
VADAERLARSPASTARAARSASVGRLDEDGGRFPIEPFPAGWFVIGYADDLPVGEVRPLTYFGRELFCYRGESGQVFLRGAFCPHLGAHIGFGGRVAGDCVVCPFHEWVYDAAGVNCSIPYASRPNRRARLETWEVREVGGLLLAWYHPTGEGPSWEAAPVPELSDADFAPPLRWELEIPVHPQEVLENAVDLAHFLSVHQAAAMPDVRVEVEGPRFTAVTTNQRLKSATGYFDGAVTSELWGLGIDVARVTGVVDTVVVLGLTPISEGRVHARFAVTARVRGGHAARSEDAALELARKAQERAIAEFKADLVIWEHKRYEPSPKLTAGERLIVQYRRWAQQFYVGSAG